MADEDEYILPSDQPTGAGEEQEYVLPSDRQADDEEYTLPSDQAAAPAKPAVLNPSKTETAVRTVAHAAPVILGSLPAMVGGAEVGAALGTPIGGPVGAVVGGLLGGAAGGLGAGYLLEKVKHSVMSALGLTEGNGFWSDNARIADQITNPNTAMAADVAAALIAFNTTAAGKTVAERLLNRGIQGAAMGGLNAAQDLATDGEIHGRDVLQGALTGALLPGIRKGIPSSLAEAGHNFVAPHLPRIEAAGQALARGLGRSHIEPTPRSNTQDTTTPITPNNEVGGRAGNNEQAAPVNVGKQDDPNIGIENPPERSDREYPKDQPSTPTAPVTDSLIDPNIMAAINAQTKGQGVTEKTQAIPAPRHPTGAPEPGEVFKDVKFPQPKETAGFQEDQMRAPRSEMDFGDVAIRQLGNKPIERAAPKPIERTAPEPQGNDRIKPLTDQHTKDMVDELIKSYNLPEGARAHVEDAVRPHVEETIRRELPEADRRLAQNAENLQPVTRKQAPLPAQTEGPKFLTALLDKLDTYPYHEQAQTYAKLIRDEKNPARQTRIATEAMKYLNKRPGQKNPRINMTDRTGRQVTVNDAKMRDEYNSAIGAVRKSFAEFTPPANETAGQAQQRLRKALQQATTEHGSDPWRAYRPRDLSTYGEWQWMVAARRFVEAKTPNPRLWNEFKAFEETLRKKENPKEVDPVGAMMGSQNRRAEFDAIANERFGRGTNEAIDQVEASRIRKEGVNPKDDVLPSLLDKKAEGKTEEQIRDGDLKRENITGIAKETAALESLAQELGAERESAQLTKTAEKAKAVETKRLEDERAKMERLKAAREARRPKMTDEKDMRHPPYAVRADHDKRIYEVYNYDTGEVVHTEKYNNELNRGRAAGRSTVHREELNNKWRKENLNRPKMTDEDYSPRMEDLNAVSERRLAHDIEAPVQPHVDETGKTLPQKVGLHEIDEQHIGHTEDGETVAVKHQGKMTAGDLFALTDWSKASPGQGLMKTLLQKYYGDTPIFVVGRKDMKALNGDDRTMGYFHSDIRPEHEHNTGKIVLADWVMRDPTTLTHVLLHEVGHNATMKAIHYNPEARAFVLRMREVALEAFQNQGHEDVEGLRYGLKKHGSDSLTAMEFMAEAMSNPEMQKFLATVKAPADVVATLEKNRAPRLNMTMFDTLKGFLGDLIRKVLGTRPPENMLDATLRMGDALMYADQVKKHAWERDVRPTMEAGPTKEELRPKMTQDDPTTEGILKGIKTGLNRTTAAIKEKGVNQLTDKDFPSLTELRDKILGAANPVKDQLKAGAERVIGKDRLQQVLNGINAKHEIVKHGVEKYLGIPLSNASRVMASVMAQGASAMNIENSRMLHALEERWAAWRFGIPDTEAMGYMKVLETHETKKMIETLRTQGHTLESATKQARDDFYDVIKNELLKDGMTPEEVKAVNAKANFMADEMLFHRKIMDQLYEWDMKFGSQAEYVDNYVSHIFKDHAKATAFIASRIQQLGPTWYQKPRMFETIEAAVKEGKLELKYKSPIDIIQARWQASTNANLRVASLRKAQEYGIAVPKGELKTNAKGDVDDHRSGWANQKFYAAGDHQHWLIDPAAERIFQNAVDTRGLQDRSDFMGSIARGWMDIKRVWMPIQLGLSAFHYLHLVVGINQSQNLARAVNLSREKGDWVKNLADAGKLSFTQPFMNLPLDKLGFGLGKSLDEITKNGFSGAIGRKLVDWTKLTEEQLAEPHNAEAKFWMDRTREAGYSPHQPWQDIIGMKRRLQEALHDKEFVKAIPIGIGRAIEKVQEPLFKWFIPQLKNEQFMRGVQALYAAHPDMMANQLRREMALHQLSKNIDDRYGEMFYNSMFMNKYVKEVGIGASVSLAWNWGQVRQAGGAVANAVRARNFGTGSTMQRKLYSTDDKGSFIVTYAALTMGAAALMTMALSGSAPEGLDYFFPRTGLKNADGTPARLQTPFNTREIPMAIGHAQEHGSWFGGLGNLVWNKTILQPVVEWMQNKDFYGRELYDTNAPLIKRSLQTADSILGAHLNPISLSGAQRAKETPGAGTREQALAWAGFGPAPKYVDHSALENRITHLFNNHVQPSSRPYEYGEKTGLGRGLVQGTVRALEGDRLTSETRQEERAKLANAKTAGDGSAAADARRALVTEGKLGKQTVRKLDPKQELEYRYARLPIEDQKALMAQMTGDEFGRFVARNSQMTKTSRAQLIKARSTNP